MTLTPTAYGTGLMIHWPPVGYWTLVPIRNEHDREIVICRRLGRGNVVRWAIYESDGVNFPCLNTEGEWEFEPTPSNRDDEFLARCRFESLEAAVAHLKKYAEVEQFYYIQNRGYCGNCMSFWRVNGKGYTCNLDEAWRVTKERADQIVSSRPTVDTAWPVEQIEAAAQRHVSIEVLREQMRQGGAQC